MSKTSRRSVLRAGLATLALYLSPIAATGGPATRKFWLDGTEFVMRVKARVLGDWCGTGAPLLGCAPDRYSISSEDGGPVFVDFDTPVEQGIQQQTGDILRIHGPALGDGLDCIVVDQQVVESPRAAFVPYDPDLFGDD